MRSRAWSGSTHMVSGVRALAGMSFWGHSEKLEIFTVARWDLPCNCGLGEECIKTKESSGDGENLMGHWLRCGPIWIEQSMYLTLSGWKVE